MDCHVYGSMALIFISNYLSIFFSFCVLNTNLEKKQDASTAINTSNIGSQAVNKASILGNHFVSYKKLIDQSNEEAWNFVCTPRSHYLVTATMDISGVQYNLWVGIIASGADDISMIETIYGDKTKLFKMIPTSGLVVGFYPIEKSYIHISVTRLYSQLDY